MQNQTVIDIDGQIDHDQQSSISHDEGTISDISTVIVPYSGAVSLHHPSENWQNKELPQLLSHKFQYTSWHELRHTEVTGDQLQAPRVRKGPPEKEHVFYSLRENKDGQLIHHSLKGRKRTEQRKKRENWENAEHANLSYQVLGHKYQKGEVERILKRLFRVRTLELMDNGLVTLSSFSFPCCEELNLTNNYLNSFKCLPNLPDIRYLYLSYNDVTTTAGLSRLRKTPLERLYLYGNPIVFTEHYRHRVFAELPNLLELDGVPKLSSDIEAIVRSEDAPSNPNSEKSTCVIM